MFDSGIKAADLIQSLKNEIDVAYPITGDMYVQWLNSTEQLLYSEIIKEQGIIDIEIPEDGSDIINLAKLSVPEDENNIRFEDIYMVLINGMQMTKTNISTGELIDKTYFKLGGNVKYHYSDETETIRIIYHVKPKLKTVTSPDDEISAENVMIPIEFIELIKSKIRAEAYKIANENVFAGNWANEYNVLLENFKVWIAGRNAEYGL